MKELHSFIIVVKKYTRKSPTLDDIRVVYSGKS